MKDVWKVKKKKKKIIASWKEIESATRDHCFMVKRVQQAEFKLNNVANVIINNNTYYQQNQLRRLIHQHYDQVKHWICFVLQKNNGKISKLEDITCEPMFVPSAVKQILRIIFCNFDLRYALRIMTAFTIYSSIEEFENDFINIYYYVPISAEQYNNLQNMDHLSTIDNSKMNLHDDTDATKHLEIVNFAGT